jgi:hypothetical protein
MFNLIISIFLVKLKFRERFEFLVHNNNKKLVKKKRVEMQCKRQEEEQVETRVGHARE